MPAEPGSINFYFSLYTFYFSPVPTVLGAQPYKTTQVLTGAAASVTFSSIPQVYTHLKLLISCGSTHTGDNFDIVHMAFNSASPSSQHWTAISDGGDQGQTNETDEAHNFCVLGRVVTDQVDLKRGGGFAVDISFYRQTQYSVFVFSQGYSYQEADGPDIYHRNGEFGRGAQSAISTITFSLEFGGNFPIGSSFTLIAY